MISALIKHLYLIFSFNHNGQGLKTGKSFSFCLMFICYILLLLGDNSEINMKTMIIDIVILVWIYLITNKNTVNATLLINCLFAFVYLFNPIIAFMTLIWGIVGIIKMQTKMRKN